MGSGVMSMPEPRMGRLLPRLPGLLLLLVVFLAGAGCIVTREVPRWGLFETSFTADGDIGDPFQDVELFVTFTSPSRRSSTVRGFWDGDNR